MEEELKRLVAELSQEIKAMKEKAIEHQIRSEKFFSVAETKLENVDEHLKTLNSKVATNAKKINMLETFRDQSVGKITVIVGIISILFGLIGNFVIKWFFQGS